QSVEASAIFFAAVCWGGSIRSRDNNKLNKLIRKAGSVLGLHYSTADVEWRMLNKLLNIMESSSHPLHILLVKQNELKTNLTEMTEERNKLKTNLTQLTAKHNRLLCFANSICVTDKTCPDGWTKSCSSCYFLSTESGSWTTGREDCRTRGADLVVIHSAEEQVKLTFFVSVKQTFISTFTNTRTWIGLNDRDNEGTWKWVDGTLLTVT
uniref:C-type lectin domain-containing protein n=1 Tax=Anabas testudineus TaxID=64144 RepID=A0A3Q1JNA6_ANATE